MIERLWRSLKHEDLHGKDLADGLEAHAAISSWLAYYNDERPHSALGGRTPRMAYEGIPMPPIRATWNALDNATAKAYGQSGQRAIPTAGVDLVSALNL